MTADSLATDVGEVCDQLSAALGWRIDYVPETRCTSPAAVWTTPVTDDEAPVGRVQLQPPAGIAPRAELPVAVATARALSALLRRLQSTRAVLESRNREVSTLLKLGRGDSAVKNLSETLDELLASAAELTGTWGTALFLIDPVKEALRLRKTSRVNAALIPQSQRLLDAPTPDAQALLQGSLLLKRDDPRAAVWLPESCPFGVCVPVRCQDGPLGTLWCYERRQRSIDQRGIHALQAVATQIARALERTVLQRENAVHKRLHQEVQIASRHQARSRVWPTLPGHGIDIALRSATASELSGDLCELCPLDADKSFFAMGDAVGHSIPAAMVMAVARGALRALWETTSVGEWQPSELIRQINRTLCSVTASEQFMSLMTGILDHRSGTFTYANAGHPPPWLLRRGKRTALKSHGMLCGVLPQSVYQQSTVGLEPGDWLVCFTDGVSEALSQQRQLFRAEGVLNALESSDWQTADEAANAIWHQMQRHVGHREPVDDQTLMVVHVRHRNGSKAAT